MHVAEPPTAKPARQQAAERAGVVQRACVSCSPTSPRSAAASRFARCAQRVLHDIPQHNAVQKGSCYSCAHATEQRPPAKQQRAATQPQGQPPPSATPTSRKSRCAKTRPQPNPQHQRHFKMHTAHTLVYERKCKVHRVFYSCFFERQGSFTRRRRSAETVQRGRRSIPRRPVAASHERGEAARGMRERHMR